jgi:hypothetical protein
VWTSSGTSVAVPGLKVRALLADLIMHEGRPVPAERLIADSGGERAPDNPLVAFQAKVSQLRRPWEPASPALVLVIAGYPGDRGTSPITGPGTARTLPPCGPSAALTCPPAEQGP